MQTLNNQIQTDFFSDEKLMLELENQIKLLDSNKTTVLAASELIINSSK
jgi:hypothetical protein